MTEAHYTYKYITTIYYQSQVNQMVSFNEGIGKKKL